MTHTLYEIRVAGLLPDDAAARLADVRVTPTEASTVLSGDLVDQAALLGLLARLRALHLEVIEVRRVLAPPDDADDADDTAPVGEPGVEHLSSARDDVTHRPAVPPSPSTDDGQALREETTMDDLLDQVDDLDQVGPIDYIVVEFPGNRMTGEAFPILVDLADRGLIRILDLAFVSKAPDGTVRGLELADVDRDGDLDLTVFEGASSGLLGESDLEDAGSVLEPGSAAGVLVYENTWAAPFAAALRRSGGQLVASGRIPVQAVLAALDSAESTS